MTNSSDLTDLDSLAETLAGTWPAGSTDSKQAALAALAELAPRDLIEAMLAARIIAAHHAMMDGYRRAMQPDISDADAARQRNSANAAGRTIDAALRTLEKRRAPDKKPSQADRPVRTAAADPAPKPDPLAAFTPEEIAAAEHALDHDPADVARAELAKRNPPARWEDMTPEDRRTTLAASAPLTPCQVAVLGVRLAAANRRPPAPA